MGSRRHTLDSETKDNGHFDNGEDIRLSETIGQNLK
jgi:hypothetical protein